MASSSFNPIVVQLVCDDCVSFVNGILQNADPSKRRSFPLFQVMTYSQICDVTYSCFGISKQEFKLQLYLWYEFKGVPFRNLITDDNTLAMIYHLGEAQFEVKFEPTFTNQLLALAQSQGIFQAQSQGIFQGSNDPEYKECDETNEDDEANEDDEDDVDDHVEDEDDVDDHDEIAPMEHGSGNEAPYTSDDTIDGYSVDGDVSGDEDQEGAHAQGPLDQQQYLNIDDDNEDCLMPFNEVQQDFVFWSRENNVIQKGMYFQSKAELVHAVRLWNIRENRELIVQDSKPHYWKAQCMTRGKNYRGVLDRVPCMWVVVGSSKNKLGLFQITKWIERHNCYGEVTNNNNRCITTSMIASEIMAQVREDLTYKVKNIQAQVKTTFNVDVSYDKAWNARRIAIERLYGTWPSNFDSLPKYMAELQRANPDTVVEWLHSPTSSSHIHTFKFVFWAFGPAINAFQRCIPVIFVDGTHLKGSYKGKLLTVVSKNANGQLLPVAFALVDEETNESWGWFLTLFQQHIGSQRQGNLCIISDRHQGIINVVNEMDGWHHRYCLRHVCSNVNAHFKNRRIKNLAWVIGSTSQQSKYSWAVDEVRGEQEGVWPYLRNIGLDKWTLKHDSGLRRWGNLTTNLAECQNSILGKARMLPIRSLIESTFNWTRDHFVKQYRKASNWNPPLARKMWEVYQMRERASTSHRVEVYDERAGYYTVRTNQRNAQGEYTYNVVMAENRKKCSCGAWQHQRFPCSHVIAVCGYRQERAAILPSKRYTTRTWINQYNFALAPLRDVHYWAEVDWKLQGDPDKLVTHRGRRRTRRYRNEMDESSTTTSSTSRQPAKCGICNGLGHNRKTCPNV